MLDGEHGIFIGRDIQIKFKAFINRCWTTFGNNANGVFHQALNLYVEEAVMPATGKAYFLARRLEKTYSLEIYKEKNPTFNNDIYLRIPKRGVNEKKTDKETEENIAGQPSTLADTICS
jgi:hypothetical protein